MTVQVKNLSPKAQPVKIRVGHTCPYCNSVMQYRMFDIDGTNLVEYETCLECGYRA